MVEALAVEGGDLVVRIDERALTVGSVAGGQEDEGPD